MEEAAAERTLRATHIGGATVLLEFGPLRLLTDPTFDPAGTRYTRGPIQLDKLAGPAIPVEEVGRVDAVLLSHDEHEDNLDHAGRAFLPRAGRVLTTPSGAGRLGERLGGNVVGLSPWETAELRGEDGETARVTAVPARHGPEGIERIVGEVTGFVVEWGGRREDRATTLYVSGDTVLFAGLAEELARRFRIDVALPHLGAAELEALGPVKLTMGASEAARLAEKLGARAVVPIHHEGWAHFTESRAEAERAFEAAGLADRLKWLSPGTPTDIRTS